MKVTTNITEEQIDDLLGMAGYLWEIEEFGEGDPTDIAGNPYSGLARIEDVARELGCTADALRNEVKLMCEEMELVA